MVLPGYIKHNNFWTKSSLMPFSRKKIVLIKYLHFVRIKLNFVIYIIHIPIYIHQHNHWHFRWPEFSRIKTKCTILSLYGKMLVRESPYSGIFYCKSIAVCLGELLFVFTIEGFSLKLMVWWYKGYFPIHVVRWSRIWWHYF